MNSLGTLIYQHYYIYKGVITHAKPFSNDNPNLDQNFFVTLKIELHIQ